MAKAGISLCHSGKCPDQPRGIAPTCFDPGDVAQHPIARRRLRSQSDSDISREPEVEITIEPLVIEKVDRGRQMDRGTVPGRMIASLLAETDNLAKPQTMGRGLLPSLLDLERAPATKRAKADRELRL